MFWEMDLAAVTIPLVVREVDAGAFWTGELPYDTGGVAGSHPHVKGVTWHWAEPWATLIEEFRPVVPSAPCNDNGDIGYDGISPDHFVITAGGFGVPPYGIPLTPQPDGYPIVLFSFDVTDIVGSFEIDTACASAQLYDILLCEPVIMGEPKPCCFGPSAEPPCNVDFVFNKGIVTIAECDCGAIWGDVNADGKLHPVDVAYMVNYVYKQLDGRVSPPICPYECGDVNCDGSVEALDVSFYVATVFRGLGPFPCSPCD